MSLPANVQLIAATAVVLLAIGVTIAVQRSGDDLLAGEPASSGALPTTEPAGQPTTPSEAPTSTVTPDSTPTAAPSPTSAPTNGEVADQLTGVDGSTHLPNTGAGLAALGMLTALVAATAAGRRRPL
ncbi:MAG: hypothetical protein R3249_02560 [Nitriliruptorales bacterium]|nr:hypothetical protein [Nitriliruptorales bacterium]